MKPIEQLEWAAKMAALAAKQEREFLALREARIARVWIACVQRVADKLAREADTSDEYTF